MLSFSKDAFSSGQVGSKIWLCENLEKILAQHQKHEGKGYIIWIYGGWIGLLAFLLFSRKNIPIQRIVNFDLDAKALANSVLINEYWNWKGTYRAIQEDICLTPFSELSQKYQEPEPHVVINTSIEHMRNRLWYETLPPKKLVALQSTNLEDDDHHFRHQNFEHFAAEFPITDSIYTSTLNFYYSEDNQFDRFMNIGFR